MWWFILLTHWGRIRYIHYIRYLFWLIPLKLQCRYDLIIRWLPATHSLFHRDLSFSDSFGGSLFISAVIIPSGHWPHCLRMKYSMSIRTPHELATWRHSSCSRRRKSDTEWHHREYVQRRWNISAESLSGGVPSWAGDFRPSFCLKSHPCLTLEEMGEGGTGGWNILLEGGRAIRKEVQMLGGITLPIHALTRHGHLLLTQAWEGLGGGQWNRSGKKEFILGNRYSEGSDWRGAVVKGL